MRPLPRGSESRGASEPSTPSAEAMNEAPASAFTGSDPNFSFDDDMVSLKTQKKSNVTVRTDEDPDTDAAGTNLANATLVEDLESTIHNMYRMNQNIQDLNYRLNKRQLP